MNPGHKYLFRQENDDLAALAGKLREQVEYVQKLMKIELNSTFSI